MRSMIRGLVLLLLPVLAQAAPLDVRLPQIEAFFPQAERLGSPRGEPPAVPVYSVGRLLGYVFQTMDVVQIPAYSGKPVNLLVGIDTEGRITGVRILEHHEPILLAGVSEQALADFVDQYTGQSALDPVRVGASPRSGHVHIDTISGATVTVMVLNETIMQAARKVLRTRRLSAAAAGAEPQPGEPIWMQVWRDRVFQIAGLGAGLLVLTLILIFQDWLTRRPRLLFHVRVGFLIYTVVFIGVYALAQLSVVNVLTFTSAVFHDFQWDTFLIDPMMFILWAFVAMTLLLWGRGVYCGWLCPYGAVQELINKLARRFGVPQFEFPFAVHERLWALKYLILLVLFGISLQSLAEAEKAAEVEPFKTAVTLRFQREWGYVLYAGGLILVSLFNRKFYCRYLCPLGAALAIPARIRLFDWLKRRNECGNPCQICANECEVQCIHPTGEINANECHYCLDCQVTYFNAYKCPPLVAKRKRREKAATARESVRQIERTLKVSSGLEGLPSERADERHEPKQR